MLPSCFPEDVPHHRWASQVSIEPVVSPEIAQCPSRPATRGSHGEAELRIGQVAWPAFDSGVCECVSEEGKV